MVRRSAGAPAWIPHHAMPGLVTMFAHALQAVRQTSERPPDSENCHRRDNELFQNLACRA